MKRTIAALAAFFMTTISAQADIQATGRCSEAVAPAIAELQLDRSRITAIRNDVVYAGTVGKRVTGVNFWLSSGACEGSLVLVLTYDCRFIDTFTRGACTIDDFRR